jgi:hypothetical protein
MTRLARELPVPLFTAAVHVAGGVLCLALTALIRGQRSRKTAIAP